MKSPTKSSQKRLLFIFLLAVLAGFISIPSFVPNLRHPEIHINLGRFSFNRDLYLKLGLDLAGGSYLAFEADVSGISPGDRQSAIEGTKQTIERRVNLFGVSESIVQTSKVGESYRVVVELPGVKNTQSAVALIGQTARLDFRELKNVPEATISATLATTQSTGFTGADFKRANPAFDSNTGKPIISFETRGESAQKFADITARLVGKPLVIFLDETPVSAPVVQQAITGGSGQITGSFTTDETRTLANLLNSGALPVPVKLIEQRTVEASLGAEAVHKSVVGGLVGVSMIALFMILSYRKLGIISIFSLAVYGLLTLAIYKLLPVTLTLPGIAGFILSVGMAVDTNILVFERMKEELRGGKDWADAVEAGFSRAWSSIRDANLTTLFIAFVLFNPFEFSFLNTSGVVRGFALTLSIGVLISLFTGIFVTRTFLRVLASVKIMAK